MNSEFWNDRYKVEDFAYGLNPNEFLVESVETLRNSQAISARNSPLKVLCIAEGEGRNALYLAKQGFEVFGVDYSAEGMTKLQKASEKEGLSHLIHTEVADLNNYDFHKDAEDGWDMIVSIFAHTPPLLQSRIFQEIKSSLKVGGWLIYTAYHPDNLGRGTGGPPVSDMCMTLERLQASFPVEEGCRMGSLEQVERTVNEGKYHQGLASVVQMQMQKV